MSFLHNFKTEIKLFFLVVLIAVVVSVGGILLLKEMQISPSAPSSQPSPTSNETAHWKTYINKTYHYTFNYPSSWHITSLEDSEFFLTTAGFSCDYETGESCSSIGIYSTAYDKNIGLEPVFVDIDEENGLPPLQIFSKKIVSVDGYEALEMVWFQAGLDENSGALSYMLSIDYKHANKVTISYGEFSKHFLPKNPDEWKNKKTFDQILSTFRFVK